MAEVRFKMASIELHKEQKREWQKPSLTDYGTIESVTLAGCGGANDGVIGGGNHGKGPGNCDHDRKGSF
jgi:hypothetical protein